MAAQASFIVEIVAGMKKALQGQHYSSDSDGSPPRATNRGNKLKRKSQFINEGSLCGPKPYRRKIDHAGYERYIISRNPKRYDDYGDELEADEEDERADAEAAEENPYSEIKLEELLMPLTSAAALPNHPSLATPYKSKILTDMARQAGEMLHKERHTLREGKTLLTHFRGDMSWISCETLLSESDAAIFPIDAIDQLLTKSRVSGNTPNSDEKPAAVQNNRDTVLKVEEGNGDIIPEARIPQKGLGGIPQLKDPELAEDQEDLASMDAKLAVNGDAQTNNQEQQKIQNPGSDTVDEPFPSADAASLTREEAPNDLSLETAKDSETVAGGEKGAGEDPEGDRVIAPAESVRPDDRSAAVETGSATEDEQTEPVPAHRMTTRAQAQAVSDKTTSSHTQSPTPEAFVPPPIHPLFLLPASSLPDRDFGLPYAEAEETRRVLMTWVQKQEEVVRGAERLYHGLLKADRMRRTVWGWCKAEGHVGEMSDGEDWYDKEEWGLEEDLKKGALEEDDEAANPGKKTRGRRAAQ